MATSPVKLQQGYGIGNALQNLSPFSIIANRVPTQQDKARIGTFWIYTGANNVYVLSSVTGGLSNWLTLSNAGAGVFISLTVNGPTQLNGPLTQVAGPVSLGADATANAISIGTGAALKTINIGSQFAGSSVSAFGPFVINSPFAGNSTLTLNCFDAAAIFGQQTLATIPGARFEACRWLNQSPAAGSGCQISIWVSNQGVAGGDAALRFINDGVNGTLIGLDTSANQFCMSMGNLGDAGTFYTYDVATSQINMPLQCCWSYYASAQPDITGGAVANDYTVRFANQNYNIATTVNGIFSTFTVPKTGKYLLSANVRLDGLIAGMTVGYLSILSGATTIAQFGLCNPFACSAGGSYRFGGSTMLALNAGAVLSVVITVVGAGTNDADIPAAISTNFNGQLLS